MKFLTVSSLGLSALLLGLSQTPARGFTLDLFSGANDSAQFVILFPGQMSGSDTDTAPILGTDFDERKLELTLDTNNDFVNISINPTTTRGSVNSGNSQITSAKFTWGSDNSSPQDFTKITGHDSLQLEILTYDKEATSNFTFTVYDNNEPNADTAVVTKQINSTGPEYFLYSDFETNNPDIDLEYIEKVELEITGAPTALNTSFDFIQSAQAVPFEFSPTLGIIIGGSFIGFNALKKRSKKK